MDIVLFIIVLCFRASNEKHSYKAIRVLSVIGGLITLTLGLFSNCLFLIDFAVYVIIMWLASSASNDIDSKGDNN